MFPYLPPPVSGYRNRDVVDIEGDRFPFEHAVDHFASIYEKIMDELEAEMGEDDMSLSGEFQLYPAVYGVAVPKSAREILSLPSASEKLKGTAGSSKISLRPTVSKSGEVTIARQLPTA